MQHHRKMTSVEEYPYEQTMFKPSNPPTSDLGLEFPSNNTLEYFNFQHSQPLVDNSTPTLGIHESTLASMAPSNTGDMQPNFNQVQPHALFSSASYLGLDNSQMTPSLDPLSSIDTTTTSTSTSNLTPFDHTSQIPSSATTSHFSTNGGFISDDSVFPPVDAFAPPSIDAATQQQQLQQSQYQLHQQGAPQLQQPAFFPQQHNFIQQQQLQPQLQQPQPFQRSRYLSEPNIMTATNNDSPFSLSPQSITFGSSHEQTSTTNTTVYDSDSNLNKPLYPRYRVIRGISSGGSATKPPRIMTSANHHYTPVNLDILDANLEECCYPSWDEEEKCDKRRIIRVERYQVGSKIVAQFSIVGSAKENPTPKESQPGVDVVEISCLECYTKSSEDTDAEEDAGFTNGFENDETRKNFYITSVEVIKIVELLIGTEVQDPAERRRERGRIRSNLVPFWSKRPISSRMSNNELRSNSSSPNSSMELSDFRIELATRIMAYETRKPRGFDKEVRILKWEKLIPALRRALQSYYVEIPDGHDDF